MSSRSISSGGSRSSRAVRSSGDMPLRSRESSSTGHLADELLVGGGRDVLEAAGGELGVEGGEHKRVFAGFEIVEQIGDVLRHPIGEDFAESVAIAVLQSAREFRAG